MVIARQRLTLDEFLKLPEQKPALEYADGMVTRKVAPKGRHSLLQSRFAQWINERAVPLERAYAFPELRTTFGGRSPVPDVAVYRWDQLAWGPDAEIQDEFFEPPLIAVEIASPDQSVRSLIRKCQWYVEHGVLLALLLNSDDYSVRLFRPGATTITLRDDAVIDLSPALPGFQLPVRDLFAMLRRPGSA
jgi:Uma2 family endonuclease